MEGVATEGDYGRECRITSGDVCVRTVMGANDEHDDGPGGLRMGVYEDPTGVGSGGAGSANSCICIWLAWRCGRVQGSRCPSVDAQWCHVRVRWRGDRTFAGALSTNAQLAAL
eukprot:1505212-Prymnesium_polylepis.1